MSAAPSILATRPDAEAVLVALLTALHEAGAPAHRVEEAGDELGKAWGLEVRVLAGPTSLHASFGPPGREHGALRRLEPASVSLARLTWVENRVAEAGRAGVRATARRLASPPETPWTRSAVLLAEQSLAGAAAVAFGGNAWHLALAVVVVTVATGVLAGARRLGAARVAPVLAAAAGTAVAALAVQRAGVAAGWPGLAGGLIGMVPGFGLTTAMTELAAGHLLSGTGRLAAAVTSFLQVGLGVAAAVGMAPAALVRTGSVPSLGALAAAEIVAGATYAVLLQANARDVPRAALAALGTWGMARMAAAHLGPAWGTVFAAAVLSAMSHRLARPAARTMVPGVLALVPGSTGFGGVVALLGAQADAGVAAAFAAAQTAVALGTGVLMGALAGRR